MTENDRFPDAWVVAWVIIGASAVAGVGYGLYEYGLGPTQMYGAGVIVTAVVVLVDEYLHETFDEQPADGEEVFEWDDV